jgi:hypothetical protein
MGVLLNFLRFTALAAFVASLGMPLFKTAEMGNEWGINALLFGWVCLIEGKLAWLANPLMLLSLLALRRLPHVALIASAAALFVAVFEYPYSYVDSVGFDSGREIEAGRVTGFGTAAYAWLASLALSFAYSVLLVLQQHVVRRDAH